MTTLSYTIDRGANGRHRVALAGAIDETSDIDALFAEIDHDAVIDLSAIERINSIGGHRWIRAIARLTSQHRISIEACSYPVVLQANVVSNFFSTAEVRSCMAPYFCPACNQNVTVLVTRAEVHAADGAPDKECSTCGGPMEFDELDSYLGFLAES